MTPCPTTTRTVLTRTGALAVVFGTAFGLAMGPAGLALAQDTAPSTVLASIKGDGSVDEVDRIGSDEEAGDLPVTLGIVQEIDGDTSTHTYTVENTTVQKQTVNYLGADNQPATVEQDVALPLVGQLAVRLPASRTDVEAVGARITKLSDGSTELVWSLVLFGPIGSPLQDVSFSSSGEGEPTARLDVAAVQPNSTPGLSATAQAANATVNGNGILNTVATGANEGLVKLSTGVGTLIVGLEKLAAGANELNAGIETAAVGANKLADGSATAKTGAADLAAGSVKLDAGAGKLNDGLKSASAGGAQLAAGGAQLAPGASAAAAGATKLSDGLALISGGLDQLSAAPGLPTALAGAQRLRAGVELIRTGIGEPATSGTLLNGLAQVSGGLGQLAASDGLPAALGGLQQIKAGVDGRIIPGLGTPTADGTIRFAVEEVRAGLADGSEDGGGIDQLVALVSFARSGIIGGCPPGPPSQAPATPCQAANTAIYALDHEPNGDEGGLKQRSAAGAAGLGAAGAGLTDIVTGLTNNSATAPGVSQGLAAVIGVPATSTTAPTGLNKAIAGIGQLRAGVDGFDTDGDGDLDGLIPGLNTVAAGLKSGEPLNGNPARFGIAEGLDALVAGLTTAVGGVTQLSAGADDAYVGSQALADGNRKVADGAVALSAGATALNSGLSQLYTGSQELKAGTGTLSAGAGKLAAGVGQIADGQRQVADGLPAAVDGSGQIADGLDQVVVAAPAVEAGLTQVKTAAVDVLASQFKQGSELAKQQLAGLEAASKRITDTPGAATTTYILTQDAEAIDASLVSDESDLGRNAAIGVGGALLLMTGIAGGFISGRRKTAVA